MSGRRPRVLVCDPLAEEGLEELRRHFDVDVRIGLDEEALAASVGDYHALVVRSATPVSRRVLEQGRRLEVVARAGAGLDTIDVETARRLGVEVVNSPDANTLAVAELTLALALALARDVPRADRALKEGRWAKSELVGVGLAGKTFGIVGFGRVGRAVASRAAAFDMRVVVNQRRPTPELALEAGVETVDLYELLAVSDVVSLHVPLREDTVGLIGRRELESMKPSAYLINTSRGPVVDRDALLDALDRGVIAGAGLDVFVDEPAVDDPLARHPKVVATPHIGASTEDAQVAAALDVARRLAARLGDPQRGPVLPLRFVPLEDVVPHEATDPRRVERLAARIERDGVVRDPPIVARLDDRYVVLDGATRVAALERLGSREVVVQETTPGSDLGLETWHHVVRGIEVERLLELVGSLDSATSTPSDPAIVRDRVIEYGGIASVTTADGRAFLVEAAAGANRFTALSRFADAYSAEAEVSRTLERDLWRLQRWHPDLVALVEYPEFSVEQVLLAARSGRVLPAGVTRFVVPGRVLRLDVPLALLRDGRPVEDKDRWLEEMLSAREREGRIRYYREPVYLLDD